MLTEDILNKLAKLKTLAERSSNVNEAAIALEKMQRLLMEHDLTEAAISASDPRTAIIEKAFSNDVGNLVQWRTYIINTVASLYQCKILYRLAEIVYNRKRTSLLRRIFIVGKEVDVEAVIYICNNIISQAERLCEAAVARTNIYGSVKKWKNSWYWGAMYVIGEYLKNKYKETLQNNEPMMTRALVKLSEVEQYMADNHGGAGVKKDSTLVLDKWAVRQGAADAKNITVQPAAAAGISNVTGLLEE